MSLPSHALLLSAGLGTRLRPLTTVRAKGAVPLAGAPLVRRIGASLAAAGITELTVNLHHLPGTITRVLGDGSDLAARVRYSWEQPQVLGSAGGPRQALDIVGAERFWIVNGDTLTDVPLADVATAHARSGALVTLAVIPNVDHERYGGVRIGGDGIVSGFAAKGPSAAGSFHFVGIQLAEAAAFASLPRGEVAATIGGLYDRLIAERPGSVRAHVCQAKFWDIGTVADYWHTSETFGPIAPGSGSSGTVIDPSAVVTRSIVWDDVHIGRDVRLDTCIVTDRVHVPDGTSFAKVIMIRVADDAFITMPLDVDGHV